MRQPDPFNVRDHLLEAGISADEVERMLRGRLVGALVDDHSESLLRTLVHLQDLHQMTSQSYGNFMGGDPRRFTPDPDASTPEERERHRLACEAAARGEPEARNVAPGSGITEINGQPAFAQFSNSFGLGTTDEVDVDLECAIAGVERAVALLDRDFTATRLPEIVSTPETPLRTSPASPVADANPAGETVP